MQSQQWISYCDLELSHSNFSQVESIFSRCLRISTSVDLWRFYLDYIRRINPIDPTNIEAAKQTRSIIAGAFEFALAHIGQDRRAGEIWIEFLNFLREGPVRSSPRLFAPVAWSHRIALCADSRYLGRATENGRSPKSFPTSSSSTAEQRRADLARLQRVREWIEQDDRMSYLRFSTFFRMRANLSFVQSILDTKQAKKFIAELSPSYMTARKCLRELRAQHDALYTPLLPHPPDWTSPQSITALEGWKRYLSFEEMNPLEMDDLGSVMNRVSFAYRKALACLRFYAEIWYVFSDLSLSRGALD